eukprot:scaffold111035_cov21-Tisochrysis_lutea.AAC.1
MFHQVTHEFDEGFLPDPDDVKCLEARNVAANMRKCLPSELAWACPPCHRPLTQERKRCNKFAATDAQIALQECMLIYCLPVSNARQQMHGKKCTAGACAYPRAHAP